DPVKKIFSAKTEDQLNLIHKELLKDTSETGQDLSTVFAKEFKLVSEVLCEEHLDSTRTNSIQTIHQAPPSEAPEAPEVSEKLENNSTMPEAASDRPKEKEDIVLQESSKARDEIGTKSKLDSKSKNKVNQEKGSKVKPPANFEPSGKIAALGFVITPICGVLAGFLPALIYGLICSRGTFYCNLLIAGGVSYCSYFGIEMGVRLGKVRNRYFTTLMGVIAGLATIFGAWSGYALGLGVGFYAFNPASLWAIYKLCLSKGLLHNWGEQASQVCYALETLALFAPAIFMGWSSIQSYCEDCDQFLEEQADLNVGYCNDHKQLQSLIFKVSPQISQCFQRASQTVSGVIKFKGCSRCDNLFEIKVINRIIELDKHGNPVEKDTPIVESIVMDKRHITLIRKYILNRA
ncbi:hypothetical protein MJH12_12480, partial [bacterium]|nr:hypothetical protein [bacterium]